MRLLCRKNGFSLVETLAVISVITVLVAMVLGVGKHVKDQAKIKLTKSTIDILVTAVEMYYEDEGTMPFETVVAGTSTGLSVDVPFVDSDFALLLGGTIICNTDNDHTDPAAYPNIDVDGDGSGDGIDWSSEAMYYYLCKSINSRRIINTINNSLVTSLDSVGIPLNIDVVDSGGVVIVDDFDMLRFVDAWGNTLRYNYVSGSTFCVISSPGKDKLYGTADDINNLK